jgi:hypothetical protein
MVCRHRAIGKLGCALGKYDRVYSFGKAAVLGMNSDRETTEIRKGTKIEKLGRRGQPFWQALIFRGFQFFENNWNDF